MARIKPFRGSGAYESFRQKSVQRFTNHDKTAQNHIYGRNRAVAKLLAFLSMAHNAGMVPAPMVVSHAGARYQTTSGSGALNQEGAHCLPRQILVCDSEPADLGAGGGGLPSLARQALRFQFGKVTVAPKAFNTADKAAEGVPNGIIQALTAACRAVLSADRQAPLHDWVRGPAGGMRYNEIDMDQPKVQLWRINHYEVTRAYQEVWKPLAAEAYDAAFDEVQAKGSFLSAGESKDEVLYILERYYHHHDETPTALGGKQLSALEALDFIPTE
jgi:hypothetical protein